MFKKTVLIFGNWNFEIVCLPAEADSAQAGDLEFVIWNLQNPMGFWYG